MRSVRVHGPGVHVKTTQRGGHLIDHWRIFLGAGVGTTIVVTPHINPDWPPDLQAAWETRRAALLTGRCPKCDARTRIVNGPNGDRLTVHHDDTCQASDAVEALQEWADNKENVT